MVGSERAGAWWLALAGLPFAVIFVLVGVSVTGASAPTLLGDPGPVIRWGLPIVTATSRVVAGLVIGGLLLLVAVLPAPGAHGRAAIQARSGRAWSRVRTLVAVAGPVWAVLCVADLIGSYAMVSGEGLAGEAFGEQLGFYVTELPAGRSQLLTVLIAAAVGLACVAVTGYGTALVALLGSLVALIPLASTGHAAGAANHDLGMTSVYLHVVGAAAWSGGIAALVLVAGLLRSSAADVVGRFSVIAGWCFAVVAVSGVAAAWMRLGNLGALGTGYGALVLAKVAALVALGLVGWWHRRRTIARMREGRARLFWRLMVAELGLIAAAVGLGVAASASAPPIAQAPSAAIGVTEAISGRPAPPTPTADAVLTAFYPDLLFGLAAVALVVVYLTWVARLRRRGDGWPLGRTLSFVAGAAVFAYLSLGAPAVYGFVLLSVHMAAHMAYVLVVPILLVLGAPMTLALRALPRRSDGSRGPREWLLLLLESRWARFFSHPVVAAVNLVGSMVIVYFTPLLLLVTTTHLGHILMVVHFTLTGYLFVNAVIGVDPGPRRPGFPLRLLLVFATMAGHAFFGLALMNTTSLLAADYFGALGLPWGVDALADQRNAGEIAWGIGEIPAVALAVTIAVMWWREDQRTARRQDRAADRDGDADLVAYNEMLARLDRD